MREFCDHCGGEICTWRSHPARSDCGACWCNPHTEECKQAWRDLILSY